MRGLGKSTVVILGRWASGVSEPVTGDRWGEQSGGAGGGGGCGGRKSTRRNRFDAFTWKWNFFPLASVLLCLSKEF